jgi:hypothetical protein
LAHSPIAKVTAITTGEVVELFDGGWLPPYRGLPAARGMVARHPAPPPDKAVRVGKRIGEWVYELFITTAFCRWVVFPRISWTSIMDVEPKIAVLADEDIEVDPDRWCSYTECGQELWQIACQWVWNLRLSLGHAMQGAEIREIEWVPPKERPPLISPAENTQEAYGPWQWAGDAGRGRGPIAGEAFSLQEDGTLQGPTGAFLWLSELRQENAFTQRAVYVASASRLSSMYSA